MKLKIDNNAVIIPGETAAGLLLGISIHEIDPDSLAGLQYELQLSPPGYASPSWQVYTSDEIYLRFENDQLTTIGVMGNYSGKISQGLGIGSLVSDFQHVYGNLIEGKEDELTFERVEGKLWFATDYSRCNTENWNEFIINRPILELYITKP
jgi:hypothetical protein